MTTIDVLAPCPGRLLPIEKTPDPVFAGEMLGPMLLTAHNLTYYQSLMRGLRAAILDRRLAEHAAAVRAAWAAGDPA